MLVMDNSACRWYFLSRQPNKAWWPGLLKTFSVSVRRGFGFLDLDFASKTLNNFKPLFVMSVVLLHGIVHVHMSCQ